jgi:hypothetical protein
MLLISLLFILTLEPNIQIPFVKANSLGTLYAKGIPGRGGKAGTTVIYAVRPGRDAELRRYPWYDKEVLIGGTADTPLLCRVGASDSSVALMFYSQEGEVKLLKEDLHGTNSCVKGRFYSVLHGFKNASPQKSIFSMDTADYFHLEIDPDRGTIVSRKDRLQKYFHSSRFQDSIRWAQDSTGQERSVFLGRVYAPHLIGMRALGKPLQIFPKRCALGPSDVKLASIDKLLNVIAGEDSSQISPIIEVRAFRERGILWKVDSVISVQADVMVCGDPHL